MKICYNNANQQVLFKDLKEGDIFSIDGGSENILMKVNPVWVCNHYNKTCLSCNEVVYNNKDKVCISTKGTSPINRIDDMNTIFEEKITKKEETKTNYNLPQTISMVSCCPDLYGRRCLAVYLGNGSFSYDINELTIVYPIKGTLMVEKI